MSSTFEEVIFSARSMQATFTVANAEEIRICRLHTGETSAECRDRFYGRLDFALWQYFGEV